MYSYAPVTARRFSVGQTPGGAVAPGAVSAPIVAAAPATVTTTYQGLPGFLETVAVLGVSAAAAYTGVRKGMDKSAKKVDKIIGWVGGIGAGLVGLLYLGGKTGISRQVSLPSIQVLS